MNENKIKELLLNGESVTLDNANEQNPKFQN